MNYAIDHVLVLVDPYEESQVAPLAAMRLAAGSGALVTLLYVRERIARFQATSQLSAIENLHQVLMAPPEDDQIAPVYPEQDRRPSMKRLRAMQSQLSLVGPEDLQIRVVFRRGDPVEETIGFINESGVDVVMVESPATCKSSSVRQLARDMQRHCTCQLQIVHPPRTKPTGPTAIFLGWWGSIVGRYRKLDRAVMPTAQRQPAADA